MSRLGRVLLNVLMAVALVSAVWKDLPLRPILYGCMTVASLLLAWVCLFSRELPLSRDGQMVPEKVRRRWCRALGILYVLNAALCPLGLFLKNQIPDQDLILWIQVVGFFLICFANLIPVSRWVKK